MKLKLRGVNVARDLARGGERVDEFGAGALAVCAQPHDVAAVEAAPGDKQVFAVATSHAAKLNFARRRLSFFARRLAGESEARVTFDALARGEQREPLGLAVVPARFDD